METVNLENPKNVNLEFKLENSPKSDKEMKKKHQKFNTMGRPNVGDWTSSRGESIGKELMRELNWGESNWRGTTASSKKVIKGGGRKGGFIS